MLCLVLTAVGVAAPRMCDIGFVLGAWHSLAIHPGAGQELGRVSGPLPDNDHTVTRAEGWALLMLKFVEGEQLSDSLFCVRRFKKHRSIQSGGECGPLAANT